MKYNLRNWMMLFGVVLSTLLTWADEAENLQEILSFEVLPALPIALEGAAMGSSRGALVVVGGTVEKQPNTIIYILPEGADAWQQAGIWEDPQSFAAYDSDGSILVATGGHVKGVLSDKVLRFEREGERVRIAELPPLPKPLERPAVLLERGNLYLAGGHSDSNLFLRIPVQDSAQEWVELEPFPGSPRIGATLKRSFDTRFYLVGGMHEGLPITSTFQYSNRLGWVEKSPIPSWRDEAKGVAFGESHLIFLGTDESNRILGYHTITDRWLEMGFWEDAPEGASILAIAGDELFALTAGEARKMTVGPLRTKYGYIDHGVVIFYLLLMVGIGAYFTNKEKDTKDFFLGGRKVPWWATGMSLFATMASAISLMTMPGKSYGSDWTWFMISIFSALCLPITLFLLAPLIRKLNIRTSNEYLEYRFGIGMRVLGSLIFVLFQLLGRMAPIMLLPSIALNAITGIQIEICILVMAIVTISYTFMGGLSAVIWTDTIQGFIMVGTILSCLVMAVVHLDMPLAQIFTSANDVGKLHMVDWNWDATYPTVWLFFIGTVFITFNNIGDQNFVQRVQCTANLKETRKAIALQMSVAVPINFLLFSVGTALFLYYQNNPTHLNPAMRADGVYPFFAAQRLPVGISGLVVAALLAATMSTVSSSICSVANLGVDDFYRRFVKGASEKSSLLVGRLLTLVVGVIGTGAALFLANADMPSIWDLALFLTNLVSNGVTGLFALGLLTKRANQTGAIIGVLTGMCVVFMVQRFTPIDLWLYMAIGSTVTFVVGYTASLLFPAPAKSLDGLTVRTLHKPRQI